MKPTKITIPEELKADLPQSPAGRQALAVLKSGEGAKPPVSMALDPKIKAAMEGVETSTPDSELAGIVNQVDHKSLETALHAARDEALEFDVATKSINQA